VTSQPSMPPTNGASQNSTTLPDMDQAPQYNEQLVVQWVNEKYESMKSARIKQQMIWYVNMAFYRGNQYVELVPRLSKIQTPKAPPYRVRSVTNRVKPIIRTELARLTSQRPSASVIAASSDDEDIQAAYAAEQAWGSISSRAKLEQEFQEVCWWMLITGNAFMKVWWDNQKLDYMSSPDQQNPIPGDICFGHVTPFHLYVPDYREVDIQNQPFVLNAYTKPVEWVNRFWGPVLKQKGINVQPDTVAANEILEDAYLSPSGDSEAAKSYDSVLCKEMWIKNGGCDLLPPGDWIVQVVGEAVVSLAPMYQHGRYPFIHFRHIPSGTFYGTSVIEDLVPLQREYNRTRSQIVEAKNRMARPQLLAARGSVDANKMSNQPGQVIYYTPGLPPPAPLPLTPLPSYVIQEQERIISDMEDLSGQHEVSRGQVPPGVTAATAISFLQEKDDSLLSHTFANIEWGMEEIARQTLSLVTQYWDIPHLIKVVGENQMFDAIMLKGSDLNGNTDIRMEGGSSLPTSKAATQALLMDMMKMGFIDPNEGLKIMEIGGARKLYENLRRDESQAQRENIRMKRLQPDDVEQARMEWEQAQQEEMGQVMTMQEQGVQPSPADPPMQTIGADGIPLQQPSIIPVNTWDNHDVHIKVHNDYRKSQAFELLSPEIKQQYELHVNMHLMAVTQAMQEAMMFGGGAGGPEAMAGDSPENAPPQEEGAPQEGPSEMPGMMPGGM
jgi:hypothetical protein